MSLQESAEYDKEWYRRAYANALARHAELFTENKQLEQRVKMQERKIKGCEAEFDQVSALVYSLKSKIRKHEKGFGAHKAEIEQLEKYIGDLEASNTEKTRTINKQSDKIAEYKDEVKSRYKQIEEIRDLEELVNIRGRMITDLNRSLKASSSRLNSIYRISKPGYTETTNSNQGVK